MGGVLSIIEVKSNFIFSSVDAVGRDAVGDSLMLVSYNGAVQWTPPTHIKVWCDSSDLGHWPSDVHACQILLGFSTDPDFLLLQFNETASNTVHTFNFSYSHYSHNAVFFSVWNAV